MSERVGVFVVSIEAYPAAPGLALRDANADARAFLDAVLAEHPGADIVWCASPAAPGATHGATRPAIIAAIEEQLGGPLGWRAAGLDRLYAYVSGHGVSLRVGGGVAAQAMVTAERSADGDGALLSIDELQDRLAAAVGPGAHHWFSDVCRVDLDEVAAPLDGPLFRARDVRPAWRSWVWSTAPRTAAASRSGFGAAVAHALEGDARRWTGEPDPAERHLTLSNRVVGDYVAKRVQAIVPGQEVDEGGDRGADELRRYEPPPTRALRLEGPADKTVQVTLHGGRGLAPLPVRVKGAATVELPVDHYTLQVGLRWAPVPAMVDLLALDPPPTVELVPRPALAPRALGTPAPLAFRLRALDGTRLALPRARLLETPLAEAWKHALHAAPRVPDHLSESLTGVPVALEDVDDAVTLAVVAAALDGTFSVLRLGGFRPLRPDQAGVYVAWSGDRAASGGRRVAAQAADGAPLGSPVPVPRDAGVTPAAFLPVPDPGVGFVRVRLLAPAHPERIVLVPVGTGDVTVLHVLDDPGMADLRVVLAPRAIPRFHAMTFAGWQLVAQRVVREGPAGARGVALPDPATLPAPPGRRALEVYGALLHRAHLYGADAPAHPPGAERDPPWLSAGWSAREDAGDPALAAWAPPAVRLRRSPLTTWIVPPPRGGAP